MFRRSVASVTVFSYQRRRVTHLSRTGTRPRTCSGPCFLRLKMFRKLGLPSLLVALALVYATQLVHAQSADTGRHSRPRITQNIDEGERVTLTGNTHRAAFAFIDVRGDGRTRVPPRVDRLGVYKLR